jgi:hypothetical protein
MRRQQDDLEEFFRLIGAFGEAADSVESIGPAKNPLPALVVGGLVECATTSNGVESGAGADIGVALMEIGSEEFDT